MITRYRGDTQRLKVHLQLNSKSVDLTLVTKVEFALAKSSNILVIEGIPDGDTTSGIVYVPFNETDLDEVGTFPFDVQVTWTDTTKTTFMKDKIKLIDDVNKT
jgi:hypothetical protein